MMIADYINTGDPFLLFFGGFYLVLGFSCFFARKPWEEFTALFIDNDALSLVAGILILPISLSIIAFYNNWETLASTILMVIGYLAFLKSLVLLMRPSLIQAFVQKEFVRKWIWLDGISGVVLGLALLLL
ncbi:MAG TPA: hypothetical protein PK513_01375 [Alphaproteobacteria bacterium]|nr:hypothetical protein [Alphaproteobacteria bacterium]USO06327.1 MAG: hypothetical protein H6859_03830 [Rhodospirillales bacterium]HOO81134.1 hypothetical protein [Alphaproteobacteria bacterium]